MLIVFCGFPAKQLHGVLDFNTAGITLKAFL
jgi:hypothetical protein